MARAEALPVAVVIPVHNDEQFLAQALTSLHRQTRKPAEIILVDNGSSDGSVAAAEALSIPNLAIIRNGRNLGATAARSIGVDAASQPWIAYLDSDDVLAEDALEIAFDGLVRADADVCLFTLVKVDREGTRVLWRNPPPEKPMRGEEALAMTMPGWQLHTLGLYARSLILRARAHFTEHGYSDDELFARICLADARKVVGCAGEYHYRSNPKRYDFSRVAGQTLTHVRSARLLEERLGADHSSARPVRNMITRNLAGLSMRALRGEGDFGHVRDLLREARSLRSRRGVADAKYLLMEAAISAALKLPRPVAASARSARSIDAR